MRRTARHAAVLAALATFVAAPSGGWTAAEADYRGRAARLFPNAPAVGFVTRSSVERIRSTDSRRVRSGASATYWRAPGGRIFADATVRVFDSAAAARASFRRTVALRNAQRTPEGGRIRIRIATRRATGVTATSLLRNVVISTNADGYQPSAARGGGRADALRLHRAIQRKVVELSR